MFAKRNLNIFFSGGGQRIRCLERGIFEEAQFHNSCVIKEICTVSTNMSYSLFAKKCLAVTSPTTRAGSRSPLDTALKRLATAHQRPKVSPAAQGHQDEECLPAGM